MGSAHRLVCIGDSLTQWFMSGAIFRTDISYPVMVADALGVRPQFQVPDFSGGGGLPINIELILRRLSSDLGSNIAWWQAVPAAWNVRSTMDASEEYWEEGNGSEPVLRPSFHHNLAVWGFRARRARRREP